MSATYAHVIADSVDESGSRLTTLEVRFHRFVLSEFNTHRVFSRNSASSRAIPISKQITRLEDDLASPVSWPSEQSGMQGGTELPSDVAGQAVDEWAHLAKLSIEGALRLKELGVHKSVVNRVLEPYMWHTVVVTSTAWENFLAQRSSELAQPEIREVAELMTDALAASAPTIRSTGQWHLPYVTAEEVGAGDGPEVDARLAQISAARCARTSYLTQDGVRDQSKDLQLFNRLVSAKPAHWSPLEHVATPWPENRAAGSLSFTALGGANLSVATSNLPRVGNLVGWRSLRTEVETAQGATTFL